MNFDPRLALGAWESGWVAPIATRVAPTAISMSITRTVSFLAKNPLLDFCLMSLNN